MKYHSSKSENTATIRIDDKLYELLIKFCDNEGRRLKYFEILKSDSFKISRGSQLDGIAVASLSVIKVTGLFTNQGTRPFTLLKSNERF